jgi:hypothetical protein
MGFVLSVDVPGFLGTAGAALESAAEGATTVLVLV